MNRAYRRRQQREALKRKRKSQKLKQLCQQSVSKLCCELRTAVESGIRLR